MDGALISGVFKIPVGDKFIFYYAQSSLVFAYGKLFVPLKLYSINSAAFIRKVMLSWYHNKEGITLNMIPPSSLEIRCFKEGVFGVVDVQNRGARAYFKQNHLIDGLCDCPRDVLPQSGRIRDWQIYILRKELLTEKIVIIQTWVRSLLRKKRLNLLALFATDNHVLNLDIIDTIAYYM